MYFNFELYQTSWVTCVQPLPLYPQTKSGSGEEVTVDMQAQQ